MQSKLKKMKKVLAVLLAITMVCGMTAFVYAADGDQAQEPVEKAQVVETPPAEEPAAVGAETPTPAEEPEAEPAKEPAKEPEAEPEAEPEKEPAVKKAPEVKLAEGKAEVKEEDTVRAAKGGSGSESDPYVLEYGQEQVLPAATGGFNHRWSINPQGYVRLTTYPSVSVKNINTEKAEQTVKVTHTWTTYIPGFPPRQESHEEVFYITCLPQTFTVTFYLQDVGQTSPQKYGDAVQVIGGTPVSGDDVPSLPEEKEGAKLYAWYTNGSWTTKADLSQNITRNTNFYAKYAAEGKIIYKSNAPSTEAVTLPDENPQIAGEGVQVTIGTASRSGYTFTKWTTEADGSGDSYTPGQKIAMESGETILYAQWDDTAAHANYFAPGPFKRQEVDKNSRANIIEDIPSAPPYMIFIGWRVMGGSGTKMYYPGETFATDDRNSYNFTAVFVFVDNSVVLKANGKTVPYNGEEQEISGVQTGEGVEEWSADFVKIGERGAGLLKTEILVRITDIKASGTDAGIYPTPISAEIYTKTIFDRNPEPFGLFVKVENNKLEITPLDVTIEMGSAEEYYTGEALTATGTATFTGGSGTITPEGGLVQLVGDDKLNMKATGSQTDPGKSDNGFDYSWGKPDWASEASTAKSYNYNLIIGDPGTLKVNKIELSFDLAGGTLNGSTGTYVMDKWEGALLKVGDVITLPEAPTRDGYEFVEWQGSSYEAGASYEVDGDHDFTAKWEKGDDPDNPNTDPEEEDKPGKHNSSNDSKTKKTETDNETGDHGMARWFLMLSFSMVMIWVLLGKKKLGNLR